jgi:hypothetical protein
MMGAAGARATAYDLSRGQKKFALTQSRRYFLSQLFFVILLMHVPREVIELAELMLIMLEVESAMAFPSHVIPDSEFGIFQSATEETFAK